MTYNEREIDKLLPLVSRPARYLGNEPGSIIKNKTDCDITFAFCFPDIYEIGMSHLGMKILYSLINSLDYALCERVFAPALDLEELLIERGLPLFSLETKTPVSEFDIVGFTLQYELSYTNILNMLTLSKIPILSEERDETYPLIIAGGPCCCNPEPLAPFFDAFILGEGEEVTVELIDAVRKLKQQNKSKNEILKALSKIQGVYVPSLYDVFYNEDNTIKKVAAKDGAPEKVIKRIIKDLDNVFYPKNFVVPFTESVHDRAVHEIFRGCTRGCRFCQAGFIYRPVREKSIETISKESKNLCDQTGYDELSLLSLSSSDYSDIIPLLSELLSWTAEKKINIALPSLRVDGFSDELIQKLSLIRRAGLTFAPEAGSQRLRDVINKNITKADILNTVRKAFAGGWNSVKMYFMIGLPTETNEDLKAIASLSQSIVDEFYNNPNKPKGKSVSVSVSASSFVPKPFTPFQWEAQDTKEIFLQKQRLLKDSITTKKVTLNVHDTGMSLLEAVFARGDRKVANALVEAYNLGCRFDSWGDKFDINKWTSAFEKTGISMAFYANRKRSFDEVLPWDHLDFGIDKDFLIRENKLSKKGVTTPNCKEGCASCGADSLLEGSCYGCC
ncbi:MAG TPA: TIGR03960 family B12-binding radical SAM protein [Oscillospiraceae bacterium]|nr:TIGR03960 family B12-binding radical SAM protein [Oscillospiraceae bacterium]